MNSNSTPFKKRNNPFSTGGTSIFDETPEPAHKVEEKPKQVVQKQKVVVSDDNNREKYTATMDVSLRRSIKVFCAENGKMFSEFVEDACKEKLSREGGRF